MFDRKFLLEHAIKLNNEYGNKFGKNFALRVPQSDYDQPEWVIYHCNKELKKLGILEKMTDNEILLIVNRYNMERFIFNNGYTDKEIIDMKIVDAQLKTPEIAKEANKISVEANTISEKAIKKAKISNIISIISLVLTITISIISLKFSIHI